MPPHRLTHCNVSNVNIWSKFTGVSIHHQDDNQKHDKHHILIINNSWGPD